MNILTKLTLRFSIIVASILILFSVAIYTVSASYRKEEFYDRLESRANTTAKLLISVQEVSIELLRIIDQNSVPALPQEKVLVFDKNNLLAYSSSDNNDLDITPDLLQKIRQEGRIRFTKGELELTGMLYKDDEHYIVVASAYDIYGRSKLRNLGTVLLSGLLIGIGLIIIAGRIFAAQALAPLTKINDQVSKITAGSLDRRVDEGNRKDEIARLAMNFNRMLKRLETAFEMQKSFVSNASHELRTPLAAMRSQLQVTLANDRSPEEYRQVMKSLLDDTDAFATLTNNLLTLAQSGMDNQRVHFTAIRVDEALFSAQEELARLRPNYHFQFDYETLPENEASLIVKGNEQLLTAAFINFMDNACKFSKDKTVHVSLSSQKKNIEICFLDNGIGIPPEEKEKIFSPFYRGGNIKSMAGGHGIGLTLCQKIVQLHEGSLHLQSEPGKGSRFSVKLPLANGIVLKF